MSSSIAKKLTNVSTLYYLFVLEKHFPDDRKKIKQKQNKNVHKLMKRAYEIPFLPESALTPAIPTGRFSLQ